MGYLPIEDYGIIGNMRTVALVGLSGSIDWFCFPRFDSPSIFGGILDEKKGGHFKISPLNDNVTHKQLYWPDTNVLITRFLSNDGVGEVTDFMPVGIERQHLIRSVSVVTGSMTFRLECFPAFNYARDKHETKISDNHVCFYSSDISMGLTGSVPFMERDNGVVCEFTLNESERVDFVFGEIDSDGDCSCLLPEREAEQYLHRTVDYWHRWLSNCTYRGRWREIVYRSALALKLLTYEPTGAIVASPTTSLPEGIGGERNWDYRYTWIRDAAFTLYALMRVGFTEEAAAFMGWLERRAHELSEDGSLQIMYGIDGRKTLIEETLDHLEGYQGSRPVRIGNGAYNQLQLDIYGELMDAVYLFNKYGSPISFEMWTHLRNLINWVCDNWQRKDEGIWEVRSGQQHYVYSKLMCWVCVDRGLRLADKRSFPADRDKWNKVRDRIYEEIMEKGWNEEREAFVQYYGSEYLDAANLIMPLVFFISPTDPMMLSTIDSINRSPEKGGLVSNSLVYRYDVERTPDGLIGEEGTFNICTFWLVEALTRAGRFDRSRLSAARLMFEQKLGYANHLGLYSEQTGHSGEMLGNFPQAFTHLALISAAFNLDRALGTRG